MPRPAGDSSGSDDPAAPTLTAATGPLLWTRPLRPDPPEPRPCNAAAADEPTGQARRPQRVGRAWEDMPAAARAAARNP